MEVGDGRGGLREGGGAQPGERLPGGDRSDGVRQAPVGAQGPYVRGV
ncbi:hypothetical protein SFUMM280S_09226 [Streptomyces fumanus]